MKDDTPLAQRCGRESGESAIRDVDQTEPEVHAEPGFENEVHAFNFFAYLSRSDVTWNPSITSVVKDSLLCPTTEEFILPIIHGNDRVEWFVQLSDEIPLGRFRSRHRRAARAHGDEGGRRRRDAGRHSPSGILAQALDAAGVGERRPDAAGVVREREAEAESGGFLIVIQFSFRRGSFIDDEFVDGPDGAAIEALKHETRKNSYEDAY